MTRLIDKEPIYLELYEALAYFRGRQQLVMRAIVEQGVSIKDLKQGTLGWQGKTPQTDNWGTEWRFMFHGGGCELKHRLTHEVIDFNGPDPEAFSPFSFIAHLEWRLASENGLLLLRAYVKEHGSLAVNDLIDDLIADGIVSPDYHLLSVLGPAQASAA